MRMTLRTFEKALQETEDPNQKKIFTALRDGILKELRKAETQSRKVKKQLKQSQRKFCNTIPMEENSLHRYCAIHMRFERPRMRLESPRPRPKFEPK